MHRQNPAWGLLLELDGAAIPWNSSIREFQKGHAHYLSEALEQPLFLLKAMAALKDMRQLELFLSMKNDGWKPSTWSAGVTIKRYGWKPSTW